MLAQKLNRHIRHMPVLISFCIISLFFMNKSHGEPLSNNIKTTIDIYGTNKLSVDLIRTKYQSEFNGIADILQSPQGIASPKNNILFVNWMKTVTNGIMTMGKFAFIGISPVAYPNDHVTHFTIDTVEQKDKYRLSYFHSNPDKTISDPDQLIATWMAYEKAGFSLFYKDRKFPSYKTCPVHHCIFGFDQKKLKRYKPIFDHYVERDKLTLIDILRNDKDNQKRAAAVFLLAHIKNANELIHILTPAIYDSNQTVRNNAMRVIGVTLQHTPNCAVSISKISNALDFPTTTDRNKALLIISTLINKPEYAHFIMRNSSNELIEELKLQQPDTHDLAYIILKKLSGKKYPDRDYESWERWLKKQNKNQV